MTILPASLTFCSSHKVWLAVRCHVSKTGTEEGSSTYTPKERTVLDRASAGSQVVPAGVAGGAPVAPVRLGVEGDRSLGLVLPGCGRLLPCPMPRGAVVLSLGGEEPALRPPSLLPGAGPVSLPWPLPAASALHSGPGRGLGPGHLCLSFGVFAVVCWPRHGAAALHSRARNSSGPLPCAPRALALMEGAGPEEEWALWFVPVPLGCAPVQLRHAMGIAHSTRPWRPLACGRR